MVPGNRGIQLLLQMKRKTRMNLEKHTKAMAFRVILVIKFLWIELYPTLGIQSKTSRILRTYIIHNVSPKEAFWLLCIFDFRCKSQRYLADLPAASIIIPFYNEHWSTLLRSVHSIIKRSPLELVKEIILVDDASQKVHLKQKLEDYIKEKNANDWENKVRVVRLKERDGLIGARLAGAKDATADVLIFLDSHIEVNWYPLIYAYYAYSFNSTDPFPKTIMVYRSTLSSFQVNVNWLPPLLDPIAEDPRTSVCPFIDVIAHDTFEYRAQVKCMHLALTKK